jgi:hypothetical protein
VKHLRQAARPAAETAMVFGLLGWLYVAAVAATRPGSLSEHVAAVLPVRRDTFGAACFLVSALCAFGLRARLGTYWLKPPPAGGPDPADATPHPPGRPSAPQRRGGLAEAALRTFVGYALLAWAYLCVNNLTHPQTTGMRLVHFFASPSEGTTAVACFAAAAVALFLLRGRTLPGDDV